MTMRRLLAIFAALMLALPPVSVRAQVEGGLDASLGGVMLPKALNNLGLQIGAKCDVIETASDGSIAASSNSFTSTAITFKASDVGKYIVIAGAGAAGAPLATTITAVSGHTATLAATATTAVPNLSLEDTAVLAAGTGYVPAQTITLAGGTHTTAAITTIDLTQVVSATVAAGGSGGTDGTKTVTGTTGTTIGTGGYFTASVTVSGGAITAVLSINTPAGAGLYSTNPTSLTVEPVTGDSLTGAQLNIVMGVAQAHPTTAGVYSVSAATLTQASSSGSGAGATFTATFNHADWYYGSDDGATINTALGGAVYNASFLLPSGGCGHSVPIVLPNPQPWGNPILRGQGRGITTLYPLTSIAESVDTGTAYSRGGGLFDLTVNAYKLATYGVLARRGTSMEFRNVEVKNALTAEWADGTGAGGNYFSDIEGWTEPGIFPPALRSTYNLYFRYSTDDVIIGSTFHNAATANIYDAAAANKYLGNHTFGYPFNNQATYGVETVYGNITLSGHEFDGAATAQLKIDGGSAVMASGIMQFNGLIGQTYGTEIATGLSNINLAGITFNQSGPSNTFTAAQAVVLDGTAPTQSILTNYPGFGGLLIGGALTVNGGANSYISGFMSFGDSASQIGSGPVTIRRTTNGFAGASIYNGSSGTAATSGLFFGNTTSTTEATIALNGGSFGGGNGANALNISGAAGVFLQYGLTNGLNIGSGGSVTMPAVTTGTNADFACFAAGGVMTLQTSACTISSLRFKLGWGLYKDDPLATLARFDVGTFRMAHQEHNPDHANASRLQIGLNAENVAKIEPRCAVYEPDGVTPKSYRQECLIGILVAGMQAQQREIEALKARRH